jgi:hypothetical protein
VRVLQLSEMTFMLVRLVSFLLQTAVCSAFEFPEYFLQPDCTDTMSNQMIEGQLHLPKALKKFPKNF